MKLFSPPILIASWFGSGFLKPAPGTWGSLTALPFGIALSYYGGLPALLAAIILIAAIGTWAAHEFSRQSGIHDDKRIVVDEVLGQWIALIPAGTAWPYIVLAFVLFRFFDIVKPWPVSYADKHIHSALGVMLDDVLAGLMAGFILLGVTLYV